MTIKRWIALAALIVGTWLVLPASAQNYVWVLRNGEPTAPRATITTLTSTTLTAGSIAINSGGNISTNGGGSQTSIAGGVDVTAGNNSFTGTIGLNNRFAFTAGASTGKLLLRNSAETAGVLADVSTDAIFKLRSRADTADASFTALDISSSGKSAYSTREAKTVDAATTFAVTSSYVVLDCTGAETINTITGGVTGMRLLIENTDTDCTIADDDDPTAANAIDLTGTATNDVGALKKVIELIYNGTDWAQTSESDN